LFHRLRLSPEFAPLSGTDEMLLGGNVPPYHITVDISASDDISFSAHLEISQFQKRMRVSKEVGVEFIARNRLWAMSFATVPEKNKLRMPQWTVTLSLLEDSPPTFVQCNLLIQDAAVQAPLTPSRRNFAIDPPSRHLFLSAGSNQGRIKPRPPLAITLSTMKELIPRGVKHRAGQTNDITVTLDDSLMASGLQSENSYISSEDTLVAKLEVCLQKPQPEGCIIC